MAMTTREEVESALRSLDFSVSQLRSQANLSTLQQEISTLEQDLLKLPTRLSDLRSQGYVFEVDLENQVKTHQTSWNRMKAAVSANIHRQAQTLQSQMTKVDEQVARAQTFRTRAPASAEPQINLVKKQVDTLTDQVKAAENAVRASYNPLLTAVRSLDYQLDGLEWMMKELHQASFQLLQTEAPVIAAEVSWYHDGKEDKQDPKGILFLTDQRLIFELHDKIVKKKVLFITTDSEIERKLMFDCPVQVIEKTETFQEGLLKGEDHLRVWFTAQGPYDHTQFRLMNRDNKDFAEAIRRVQNGDYLKNRTQAVDAEVLERVKSAPSECPACGGTIHQAVMRGQETITCEYCGMVIRL